MIDQAQAWAWDHGPESRRPDASLQKEMVHDD